MNLRRKLEIIFLPIAWDVISTQGKVEALRLLILQNIIALAMALVLVVGVFSNYGPPAILALALLGFVELITSIRYNALWRKYAGIHYKELRNKFYTKT